MSDLYIACSKVVGKRQHGVTCDVCDLWQHRICGTGNNYFIIRYTKNNSHVFWYNQGLSKSIEGRGRFGLGRFGHFLGWVVLAHFRGELFRPWVVLAKVCRNYYGMTGTDRRALGFGPFSR